MQTGIANGQGVCQKCSKFIESGSKQVVVWGYRSSGRWHAKCVQKLLKEGKVPMFADPQTKEVEEMNNQAEGIIVSLLNVIEGNLPEFYSSSDLVLKCDMWLKWMNGELNPEEKKEFFYYSPKK